MRLIANLRAREHIKKTRARKKRLREKDLEKKEEKIDELTFLYKIIDFFGGNIWLFQKKVVTLHDFYRLFISIYQ